MKKIITVVAAALVLGITATSGAVAGSFVTSADIKNHTIKQRDLSPGLKDKVNRPADVVTTQGVPGPQGPKGEPGVDGHDGHDGLLGAIYRRTTYANGGGGDATVACADDQATSMQYTAISGGVEAGHTGANDFAVTASFPGRMDWSTGTPKPGRLDGWIVLGNGEYTDNLTVWALCVPNTSISTETVTLSN